MPNSDALLSYTDCQERLDEAIASPKGIILEFVDKLDRNNFGFRIHHCRRLLRKKSQLIYPDPTSPQHGTTIYDTLAVHMPNAPVNGKYLIHMVKRSNAGHTVKLIE